MILDLVEVGENSYLYTERAISTSIWANIHKGETAIVIGNGKSLRDVPKEVLKKYPSFGVNHIYMLPFQPTYYACYDRTVLTEYAKKIYVTATEAEIAFISDMYLDRGIDELDKLYELKNVYLCNARTVIFPREYVFGGDTVVYVALKIAYVMGFSTILLVGCDRDSKMSHFYTSTRKEGGVHKGKRKMQEDHLKLAGEIYKAAGRRIINLSLPSVLDEYFERGSIDDYT